MLKTSQNIIASSNTFAIIGFTPDSTPLVGFPKLARLRQQNTTRDRGTFRLSSWKIWGVLSLKSLQPKKNLAAHVGMS